MALWIIIIYFTNCILRQMPLAPAAWYQCDVYMPLAEQLVKTQQDENIIPKQYSIQRTGWRKTFENDDP